MKKRSYPKIGGISQIHYNPKKYPGMPWQNRHCRVLAIAKKRPMNAVVVLNDKTRIVVPYGNLFTKFTF